MEFSSVQFSHSVIFDSLWPHRPQHTRPTCPSPPPRFNQTHLHWVGDAIQPSHPLLSPSPPTFPASGSFPMSQFFILGGQSIGVSASTSVLPVNIQDWFPLLWTIRWCPIWQGPFLPLPLPPPETLPSSPTTISPRSALQGLSCIPVIYTC